MFKWILPFLVLIAPAAHAVDPVDMRFSQTLHLQPYSKLRQSAQLGDAQAQFDLAYLYYKAGSDPAISGIIQSYDLAAYWYRKAAQQGHASAQYNMAVLHLHGNGVDRDPVAAYAWLLVASGNDHEGSKSLMKELDEILNEKQLRAAQELSGKLGVIGGSS